MGIEFLNFLSKKKNVHHTENLPTAEPEKFLNMMKVYKRMKIKSFA